MRLPVDPAICRAPFFGPGQRLDIVFIGIWLAVSRTSGLKQNVCCVKSPMSWVPAGSRVVSPRGFTFTWWGCFGGLCRRHKPTELAHSFYSVLVSVSVFKALPTVVHSINPPGNCPFSHSVLPVLILPFWSFQLYISVGKSPSALI